MHLEKDEEVVTLFAERARGPGFSNPLYWVIIRQKFTNKYRQDSLQPSEQSEFLRHLHGVSAEMQATLITAMGDEAREPEDPMRVTVNNDA